MPATERGLVVVSGTIMFILSFVVVVRSRRCCCKIALSLSHRVEPVAVGDCMDRAPDFRQTGAGPTHGHALHHRLLLVEKDGSGLEARSGLTSFQGRTTLARRFDGRESARAFTSLELHSLSSKEIPWNQCWKKQIAGGKKG